MSQFQSKYNDDAPPAAPPPSYEEALNAPPMLPGRSETQNSSAPQNANISAPPLAPPRPQAPNYPPRPMQPQNSAPTANSLLYTNNPNLPFEYPRGFYCSKCRNTGFKEKNGKPCSVCWSKYGKDKAYNPNPELTFRYPKGFICDRCHNTGLKLKNGLSCQDCYTRFAPRNRPVQAPISYAPAPMPAPMQWAPYNGFAPPGFGPGPGGPQYLQPGDPRMGGTMCGRCRGSGRVTFFLDQELCLVCGGVGRLFNAQYPSYR